MGAERLTAEVRAAVDHVARTSRGHLIANLAAGHRDLALAEDAFSAAMEQALRTWPNTGVPANPPAWVLTVARNHQRDVWKSAARRTSVPLNAAVLDGAAEHPAVEAGAIEDRRLELLFVCAHPAIDVQVHTPLMLQVVLGVDAARVAAAFAVSAAAMAQRLVRAKRRIKHARIPFAVPAPEVLPERLPAVLEAVYGCFAIGHDDPTPVGADLAVEAQHLAVSITELLPREPEVWSLAALIAFARARTANGGRHHGADWEDAFVPLEEQDTSGWDAALIAAGDQWLRRAQRIGPLGRFQLEAAIQAVHCDRRRTGATDWQALHLLYRALVELAPTLGAHIALAAVTGRARCPQAGLAELDRLRATWAGPGAVESYQPFHAVRAHLLLAAGRKTQAAAAFTTAAALSRHPGPRRYLEQAIGAVPGDQGGTERVHRAGVTTGIKGNEG